MKKILISSDSNGRFDLLLPKINQLHRKNNFDFVLLVGEVCPSTSSKIFHSISQHQLKFEMPTYFIDCSDMSRMLAEAHPSGVQLLPNLFYLGNQGIKQIQGVKVAYFSGLSEVQQYFQSTSKTLAYKFQNSEALKFLDLNESQRVDILLTNQWAKQYQQIGGTNPQKIQIISQICSRLSPRYHISAGGSKYLRLPPFQGKKLNPTHFINVGEIKQSLPKQKYLVAIQMNPQFPQFIENLSQSIFKKVQKFQNEGNKMLGAQKRREQRKKEVILDKNSFIMFDGFPQYTPSSQITQFLEKWGQIKQIQVFKQLKGDKKSGIVRFLNLKDAQICLKDSGKYTLYQNRIKFSIRQQNQKYRMSECFLCIENERFDKSLLVYKGKFCYVSVDKGPILDFHFQIVPINHVSSTGQLQIQQQAQIAEVKNIYQNYFKLQGYTVISLQRYMNLSSQINHAILHCVAVKIDEREIISRFNKVNYENRFGYVKLGEVHNKEKEKDTPYYIILQINSHKFIKNIERKDKRFEQGRQVICEIIDMPEKVNWRDCQVSPSSLAKTISQLKKIVQI